MRGPEESSCRGTFRQLSYASRCDAKHSSPSEASKMEVGHSLFEHKTNPLVMLPSHTHTQTKLLNTERKKMLGPSRCCEGPSKNRTEDFFFLHSNAEQAAKDNTTVSGRKFYRSIASCLLKVQLYTVQILMRYR